MKFYQFFLFVVSTYAQLNQNITELHRERVELELCEYNYEKQRLDIMFEYKLKILDVVNLLMHYHEDVDSRPGEFTVMQHFDTLQNFQNEIVKLEEERDTLLDNLDFCN